MMAECFTRSGYHAGTNLIPAGPSNPHGFFEDPAVNRLNDVLLKRWFRTATPVPDRLLWLGTHEQSRTAPHRDEDILDDMLAAMPSSPWMIKDPRLSFTLPFWTPVLDPCVVIVMVRPPAEVFESLRTMASREPHYFEGHVVDAESVGEMWASTYRAILTWADQHTVFVDESTVRNGAALEMVSAKVAMPLGGGSVDPGLHRHRIDAGLSLPSVPLEIWEAVRARCDDDLGVR